MQPIARLHRNLPFTDSAATEVRIPWCFPALTGAGIQGYWLDVPTPRAGRFSLTMSEVRPDTRFQLKAIAGGCLEDNTGKTEVSLGAGTSWTMEVGPGRYCLNVYKLDNVAEDAWLTLTAVRP